MHPSKVCLLVAFISIASESTAQVPPPPAGEDALSERYTGRAYSPYAGRGFPFFANAILLFLSYRLSLPQLRQRDLRDNNAHQS